MPHPLIGQAAPVISLPDSNGQTYTLTPGEGGAPIALFFYPKSGSFGCTKQACQFRDALEKPTFKDSKAVVVGVSPDPVDQQKVFVEKQKLTYPVLSDEKAEARKAYGVGKGMLGLTEARVTFVIDSKGIVRDALDATMNFGAHSKFVEKWVTKLDAEAKGEPAPPSPTAQEIDAAPAAPAEGAESTATPA